MSFENRSVVIVSGTANTGRALAREAAERGATVGFTYNDSQDEAQSLLAELDGDEHGAWQCDVTDASAVAETVDEMAADLGSIDALCYTAGVIARAPLEETDDETWDSHVAVNLTGAFNVLKAAAPHLKGQGHGSIIALSASDAIQREPELSAYNATKTGLIALIREAAREFAPSGVRANVVAPGPVRDPENLSADAREELIERTPLSRITTPEDIAAVSLFLCSDAAASITGAVVPVDGGIGL